MALAREWDELVEQVRRHDGLADFLKPPRLERLLPASEAGPVVIVNVSRWRCDALIITTRGIEVKQLALTAEEVNEQARAYLSGLREVEKALRLVYETRERAHGADRPLEAIAAYLAAIEQLQKARDSCEEMLLDVTGWLWDQIASPVFGALGITGPPAHRESWPRLWWCPTGLLSLLPLHAAGHHTAPGRERHESVLDRAVTSYTPTLRALLEARERSARPAGRGPGGSVGASAADAGIRPSPDGPPGDRMLIVALPETPGQTPLPNVAHERRLLTGLFQDGHTVLEGPAATWEAVRAELPRHGWVHFCCHGDQNLADPSRGGILLYDRHLSIADISQGQYRGDFAFLSACKTATGGITLADEAVTLAAALHFTGYRHVIGTLWSVHDEAAATVAEAVYTELTSAGTFEPGRAANALHTAIRGLRDTGEPLGQWTPFTHTGP